MGRCATRGRGCLQEVCYDPTGDFWWADRQDWLWMGGTSARKKYEEIKQKMKDKTISRKYS